MKKRTPILLVLSLGCVTSMVSYSAWVTSFEYSYSQSNKIQAVPVAYIVGKEDVKYTSIEKALEMAQNKGDIVCVIPPELPNYNDSTNPKNPDSVTYKITRPCTIKEGVTLFVPTDRASAEQVKNASTLNTYIDGMKKPKRDQGNGGYHSYADNNPTRFCRITIEVESGASITNNGTLLISGYLGGGSGDIGSVGQTSHSYSRIVLDQGASIVQNNANASMYCFGFIEEKSANNNSVVDVQRGALYTPCVIPDYRGFHYSYAMTDGAIDNERCSVFNQLEFRNIKALVKIHYNASVQGIINIYVKYSTLNVDETITVETGIIGSTNKFLIQQTDATHSCIWYKYNTSTSTFKAQCYGGFIFHFFALDLSLSGQTLKLNTKNAYFPLSYKFDVELLCGENQASATFDISNQRMKAMTGSKLYVGDNVTLKGNELTVYSAFYDGSNGNGQGVLNSARVAYPLKENAIVQLGDSAKINMTKLAGTIFCNAPSNITATNTEITSKEPWDMGTSGKLAPPWNIKNYLELTERLHIVGVENQNKPKICVGVNAFTNTKSFRPNVNVKINQGAQSVNVNGEQRVIFGDDITDFQFELLSNVYQVFYDKTRYSLGTDVLYNEKNRLVGITSSDRSISNNNGGVNEFEVQQIEIIGSTHDVPAGTVLQLEKNIVDLDKAYDKKFRWSSLDPKVCTVSADGLVTGVAMGTTSIKLECGGKEATYEINVTSATDIEGVASVEIIESKGTASGEAFKDGDYTFNAKIIGDSGKELTLNDITSITWVIRPAAADRAGLNGDINLKELEGVLSVKATLKGGMSASSAGGASPDDVYLDCKVVDKKGNTVTAKYHMVNDNACLVEGTDILMADRSTKKVEDLIIGDLVTIFNHETGRLDVSPIIFITHKEESATLCNIIALRFEDDTELIIAKSHALFDQVTNQYEVIDSKNCQDYIGHPFAILKDEKIRFVKLISASVSFKSKKIYCPVTAFHMNLFANSILTMPTIPNDIRGLYNFFELDKDMKYDEEKKRKDIETYGLYSYEEFITLIKIPKEAYLVSPAVYLKVSSGKGLISKEEIIQVVKFLLGNRLIGN